MNRFTIKFNCKMAGAAHPDVTQEILELTPEVRAGLRAHDTYTTQVFDGDSEIYRGSDSEAAFASFVERLKTASKRPFGGPVLSPNAPWILTPLPTKVGVLLVQPDSEQTTHILTIDDHFVASHPNGFSCRCLAERISGERAVPSRMPSHAAWVRDQADYIQRCGGKVDHVRIDKIISDLAALG